MNTTENAAKTGAGVYRAQEHLEDLGRTVGKKLDEARSGTADALEKRRFLGSRHRTPRG